MNLSKSLFRWSLVLTLTGTMCVGTIWLCIHRGCRNQVVRQSRSQSLGPSISQLERIGEVAAVRVHVADVLTADGEGLRGVWLIKGDALLSCDLSKAKFTRIDPTARTATVRLPPLHATSARIDHEKTRTWSVERSTWLPWKWGDQSAFRDAALAHAQKLIESAAASERNLAPARAQTELLIQEMYILVDWKVTVCWE